jgi:hypothetical protein
MTKKLDAKDTPVRLYRPAVLSLIDRHSRSVLGMRILDPGSLQSDEQCMEAAEDLYNTWQATAPDALFDQGELDIYLLRR